MSRGSPGLPSRRCCGRCVEMVVKERAVVMFYGVDLVCVLILCASRFVHLSTAFSPAFWQGGRGKGPQNPPCQRPGFCSRWRL